MIIVRIPMSPFQSFCRVVTPSSIDYGMSHVVRWESLDESLIYIRNYLESFRMKALHQRDKQNRPAIHIKFVNETLENTPGGVNQPRGETAHRSQGLANKQVER